MAVDGSSASASFHGLVADQYDAALLVTAARLGFIPRFRRRLNIVKQKAFIRSGSMFLWDEEESYMKRWTDGYPWSPSCVQNKFLVYREMTKRGGARSRTAARLVGYSTESSADSPRRKYIRSLASSLFNGGELEFLDMYSSSGYPRPDDIFRRDGLVKKALTITLPKETWHVVAYYTLEDILHNRLTVPSESPTLRHPRILSNVADVFEDTSRSLFKFTTALRMPTPRMPTPLPWTTPFLKLTDTKESPDYYLGISDMAMPQTSTFSSSSSSSSTPLPISLQFSPLPGVNTVSAQNGTIIEPDTDRDTSVSTSIHSGRSWSTDYFFCSCHYLHLQHHSHLQHQQPLDNDPSLTTTDSLHPSPAIALTSQSPLDYKEPYAEVDADAEDIHVNVYNGHYYRLGPPHQISSHGFDWGASFETTHDSP